jgi:hypothetical protein
MKPRKRPVGEKHRSSWIDRAGWLVFGR